MELKPTVETIGEAVDLAGVAVIVVGVAVVLALLVWRWAHGHDREDAYRRSRVGLGRSILLGLELLVAGDIIRTVAVSPTFESVGVLGAIVLIRTWLSMTLEVEISGRWPWQGRRDEDASAPK
jgi:uncharacterized membrane protein